MGWNEEVIHLKKMKHAYNLPIHVYYNKMGILWHSIRESFTIWHCSHSFLELNTGIVLGECAIVV